MFRNCIKTLVFLFVLFVIPSVTFGGNVTLIEKRIKELDVLNKNLAQKMITLPTTGTFHLKAYVRGNVFTRQAGSLLVIYDKKQRQVKEGVFPFKKLRTRS